MTPEYWQRAKTQLSAADSVMAGIIAQYEGELMQSRGDAFYTLARSIVGQQISVKAADSVWQRLEAAMPSVTPQNVLATSDEALRECGLSRQKVTYLRAIAEHFKVHNVQTGFFDAYSDDEAIAFLTEIKGVGRWTAEMFLMFHLMRPNILPVDDIGLQNAILKHYSQVVGSYDGMSKKEKYAQIRAIAEPWSPWQSVATWYLWRSLDPLPVAY